MSAAAAFAFVTVPTPVSGQCGDCDLAGEQTHHFGNYGSRATCEGWGESGCHPEDRSGHCFSVHYDCEAEQEDLLDLFAGIESGEQVAVEEALLTLAREGESDRVLVNHARKAIQLLDCSLTTVLVHVPFSWEVLTDIE